FGRRSLLWDARIGSHGHHSIRSRNPRLLRRLTELIVGNELVMGLAVEGEGLGGRQSSEGKWSDVMELQLSFGTAFFPFRANVRPAPAVAFPSLPPHSRRDIARVLAATGLGLPSRALFSFVDRLEGDTNGLMQHLGQFTLWDLMR